MQNISSYSLHTDLYLMDIEKCLLAHGLLNEFENIEKKHSKTIQSISRYQQSFYNSISYSNKALNNKITMDCNIEYSKELIDRVFDIKRKLYRGL
jgi:hypothetical protein